MSVPTLLTPVLAAAAAPPAPPPGGGSMLYPMGTMLLLLAIMYFLILRPQQVKAKEQREMVSRLKVGDRVVTTAGIYGEVAAVDDATLMLRVAQNVEVRIVRSAISTVLPAESDAADKAAEKGAKKKG